MKAAASSRSLPRVGAGIVLIVVVDLVLGWLRASAAETIAFARFDTFARSTNVGSGDVVLESVDQRTRAPWTELLLSWNASAPGGSGCRFEVQPLLKDQGPSPAWFTLGDWAESTNRFPRRSPGRQEDTIGLVDTDVLRLKLASAGFRLRAVLHPGERGTVPDLRLLCASVLDTRVATNGEGAVERPGRLEARGRVLAVPERSQHAYPGGKAWCSPTSVSMVLDYWASRLGEPSLRADLPAVAAGVHDPVWGGTGNWPFNTAYAGRHPTLRAAAIRMNGLSDVERLVERGVPVILSVSLNLVRGRPAQGGDGHLIVAVGFTASGDVWVNDPDTTYPPVPGRTVRRLYSRGDVERGWGVSHFTAYVIESAALPLDWAELR